MTELTHPLTAQPQAATAPDKGKRKPSTSHADVCRARLRAFRLVEAAAGSVRERQGCGDLPRRAPPLRAQARRGRARVLVLARRERGGADREAARDLVGDAGDGVPPRERLGDAERARHRARAPSLRRARRSRAHRAARHPAADLPAARHVVGLASAQPRRRPRRAQQRDDGRRRARGGAQGDRQDGAVLLRRRERAGADRLLHRHGLHGCAHLARRRDLRSLQAGPVPSTPR